MIIPRYFNEIIIDRQKGTVTKKSIFSEQLNSKINWYLNFTKKFSDFLPEISDERC
jgi:hypothetical protein